MIEDVYLPSLKVKTGMIFSRTSSGSFLSPNMRPVAAHDPSSLSPPLPLAPWAVAMTAHRLRQTMAANTSPPSDLAANPFGGELFERKSIQMQYLRLRKKLAAK